MSEYIEWGAIANIIVVGLLFGAGVPALFALGVRTIASPAAFREDGTVSLTRRIAAYACFSVIVLAIVGAIIYIAAGGH
ncbi:hypothetical protein [Demequina oxidasica]|uniref:hypothetical protein n=1 Tax=Demequina oxidasica TaxID=676199 RepID=UPI000782FAB4|nr:hypothetical protein [Demequina oxidasica]